MAVILSVIGCHTRSYSRFVDTKAVRWTQWSKGLPLPPYWLQVNSDPGTSQTTQLRPSQPRPANSDPTDSDHSNSEPSRFRPPQFRPLPILTLPIQTPQLKPLPIQSLPTQTPGQFRPLQIIPQTHPFSIQTPISSELFKNVYVTQNTQYISARCYILYIIK